MRRINSSILLACGLYGRGMAKNAGILRDTGGLLLDTAGAGIKLLGSLAENAALYTVAAAALGGIGLGLGAAKLTAHDNKEIDTARKAFMNERLSADLGYLRSQLRNESMAASSSQDPVKSARLLG